MGFLLNNKKSHSRTVASIGATQQRGLKAVAPKFSKDGIWNKLTNCHTPNGNASFPSSSL